MPGVVPCACGRDASELHCTSCGSISKYPVTKENQQVVIDGKRYTSRGYRCRKCGNFYHEVEPCRAQPIAAPMINESATSRARMLNSPNMSAVQDGMLKVAAERKAVFDKQKARLAAQADAPLPPNTQPLPLDETEPRDVLE